MKNFTLITFVLALFMFTGCVDGPIETIDFKSPEGTVGVNVTGTRAMSMDPIRVNMRLSAPADSANFSFDFQSSSLTKENCKASWVTDGHGVFVFELADGDKIKVTVNHADGRLRASKEYISTGVSLH